MNFDSNTGEPINNVQPPVQNKANGFAIAGFIVSLLVSGLIGLILSIIGLNKSKELNNGKGLSIAGIVIGILRIVGGIFVVFFWSAFIAFFMTSFEGGPVDYDKCALVNTATCTESLNGYSLCYYYDQNGAKETIKCPSKERITTTKPTTTTNNKRTGDYVDEDGYMVYQISDEMGDLYSNIYYLKDGKLYSNDTENVGRGMSDDDGRGHELRASNVSKFFHPNYGQTDREAIIYVDMNGQAYSINNDVNNKSKQRFEVTKIEGAVNVDRVYSLGTGGAWKYIFVNKNNQIISLEKDTIYFDKKNDINKTLIGNDVVEVIHTQTEKRDSEGNEKSHYQFKINGQTVNQEYVYIANGEDFYEDLDLVQIPACYKNNQLVIGDGCN